MACHTALAAARMLLARAIHRRSPRFPGAPRARDRRRRATAAAARAALGRRFSRVRPFPPARGSYDDVARALPPDTALGDHPLMASRTGTFSVADLDLVVEDVSIGDGPDAEIVKVVRPASEDAVLDMYVELGALDRDPYWAALWPSSVALARHVAKRENAALVRGRRVCDFGAGLGLAGLAAAKIGRAESVAFFDREPLALQCCLLSAEANGLRVLRPNPEGEPEIPDGESLPEEAASSPSPSGDSALCSAEAFDWHAPLPSQLRRFDVVLACDVLYEAAAVAPVASLVSRMMRRREGAKGAEGAEGAEGAAAAPAAWVLADPPLRAPKNRAAFRDAVAGVAAEKEGGPTRVAVSDGKGGEDDVLLLEYAIR
jgi:predicted nicotinamide N-methyase